MHAAVCMRPGVLAMRKTSCNNMGCFREGHCVLGCQGWKEYVLYVQPDAVLDTLYSQQESAPREDMEAAGVNSQFQVGAYLVADFDGMYFVGEVVHQETDGAMWVKYLCIVRGKLNKYNWPAIEDTPVEEIFVPHTYGGCNRVQYVLQEGLRDKIVTAYHKFLKR